MENTEKILRAVLDVLMAHQRELDSLNRAIAAIRVSFDSAQEARFDAELKALARNAHRETETDSGILHIAQMLEQTR